MTLTGTVARPRQVLALDTSTERMSVAVGPLGGPAAALHEGPGGAQASADLIPQILRLLASTGLRVADLDAIAFGCGPGAFTGLRTACAVVQGLAFSGRPEGIPVIPVPTLLAVADEACRLHALPPGASLLATLDARMDELYVTHCTVHADGSPRLVGTAGLSRAELLACPDPRPALIAGNALAQYGPRLPAGWAGVPQVEAWPRADALLRLAAALWDDGCVTDAVGAQPLYVRDKVALTTTEREALRTSAERPAAP